MMQLYTKNKIIDILSRIIDHENEECRRFYDLNPESDDGRRHDRNIYNSALIYAMSQFK